MTIGSDRTARLTALPHDDALDTFPDYDEPADPVEDDEAEEPGTRLVGLGFIGRAIRRRTRWWVLLAVLGLLIGSALFVTAKPTYQVTATLLLVNDQSIDQPTAMQTDAVLADSPDFAQQVLRKLKLSESVTAFIKSYAVTDVSNELLSIEASAPSAAAATTRADALSSGYLAYRGGMLNEQLAQENEQSQQAVTNAQDALDSINNKITAAQASSSTTAVQLGALKNQRTLAQDYLTSTQQTAGADEANNKLAVSTMIGGSRVIETTQPALAHSRSKTALEYVAGGAFGGAVIGIALIALIAVTSTRLRRRDDVAAALGAPVLLSVPTADNAGRRAKKAGTKRDMRHVVSYLRDSLPPPQRETSALAVVAVDNLKFVATLVSAAAIACMNDGKRVLVADLSGGALASLLKQTAPGLHSVAKDDRMVLFVPGPDDMAPAGPLGDDPPAPLVEARSKADVLISLAVLDPSVSAGYLRSWAADAVTVVTAGLSSAEKVQSAGDLIRESGVTAVSGVLLGTDKSDESLGL
jgi:capsular polysaccharide biosynthesis protein